MGACKNPYWFRQQRAKGICYICKQPITEKTQAHTDCRRMKDKQGMTHTEIRNFMLQRLSHDR